MSAEHDLQSVHARLANHAADCDICRSEPLPSDQLARALATSRIEIDAAALSQRTLTELRPQLRRRAARALWQRVAVGVLLALVPLPAVLAYDAYVLRLAYDLVSALLPTTLAAYLVLSYAAFLLLLFALTYAAIPLLVVREAKPRAVTPM